MSAPLEMEHRENHGRAANSAQGRAFRLLALCAKAEIDRRDASEIESIAAGPLDWPGLLEAARWHNVMALLWRAVEPLAGGLIPGAAIEALQTAYAENTSRSAALTEELISIVGELNEAGIPVLPFKGPALAQAAYRDVALRYFLNLDLLLRDAEIPRAAAVLRSRGYEMEKPYGPIRTEARLHIDSKLPFRHTANGVQTELHCQVVPRRYGYRLSVDRLIARSREVSLPGATIRTLSPEDCLIVLALHSLKHGFWPCLKPVSDMAGVIACAPELNWEMLKAESHRLGTDRPLRLGLSLAHDLLGAGVPGSFLSEVERDPVVTSLRDRVKGRLADRLGGFANLLKASRVHLSLRKTLPAKARYLAGVIATPSERDCRLFGRAVPVQIAYPLRAVKFANKTVSELRKAILRR